ncbi:sensor histidine kinase [Nonomuraea sp. NPDC050556]|uniref:sensor histidine kinase n=1 Tax=Nonomuraea sp. NPDC050556 TaxID=3364369 RepID=UPI00378ADFF1
MTSSPAVLRHERLFDLALAAVTTVAFVAVALATGVRSPWDAAIPLGLVLGALLLGRRRWPLAVLGLSVIAILVYHLAQWSPAGWIWPLSVAYVTAAAASRVRWVAAIGAAVLVYSAYDAWPIIDTNVVRYVVHVFGEGLLLALLIAAGLAARAAQRSRQNLREAHGRALVAEERLRVAREVHDIVGHAMAIVGIHLNVAAETLQDEPEEAAAALRLAQDVRNKAMADLSHLVEVLRDSPASAEPQPDLAAMDLLLADVGNAGLEVAFDTRGEPGAVPATAAVAVYRIVQEALANTLKHSRATKVAVTIVYGTGAVSVTVVDDGRTGPETVSERHGVSGMRERVTALGGTLTAGQAQEGFTVRAEIPVPDSEL